MRALAGRGRCRCRAKKCPHLNFFLADEIVRQRCEYHVAAVAADGRPKLAPLASEASLASETRT